jgi:hypothetical protein
MRLGVPRSILCILALMVSFPAVQNSAAEFFFVQLADMQFGMFASDRYFAQETVNYEFVVANISTTHWAIFPTGSLLLQGVEPVS